MSATIEARCTCGRQVTVPATAAGKRVRCPVCKGAIAVPAPVGDTPGAATHQPPTSGPPPRAPWPGSRPRIGRSRGRVHRQNKASLWISAAAVLAVFVLYRAWPTQHQGAGEDLPDAQKIARARDITERYIELKGRFDPAQVDLVADDAPLVNVRATYRGLTRKEAVTGASRKETVRLELLEDRAKGDTSTYSGFTYTVVPRGVRVNCLRTSALTQDTSPHEILIGATKSGEWKILAEKTNRAQ